MKSIFPSEKAFPTSGKIYEVIYNYNNTKLTKQQEKQLYNKFMKTMDEVADVYKDSGASTKGVNNGDLSKRSLRIASAIWGIIIDKWLNL